MSVAGLVLYLLVDAGHCGISVLCECWSPELSSWARHHRAWEPGVNLSLWDKCGSFGPFQGFLKRKKKVLNFLELRLLSFSIVGELAKEFMAWYMVL